MSRVMSKIKALNDLWFEPISSKPANVVRVVETGGIVVAVAENGTVYSNGIPRGVAYSDTAYLRRNVESVIDGCVYLGLLSASAIREHREAKKLRKEAEHVAFLASQIQTLAEDFGLQLTKAQKLKLALAEKEMP